MSISGIPVSRSLGIVTRYGPDSGGGGGGGGEGWRFLWVTYRAISTH